MDEQAFKNQALLTAAGLLRDDIEGGSTWVGKSLYLTRDGDLWDVHKMEQEGTDTIQIWVDTVAPHRFGSAQILGAYLIELSNRDTKPVDLPKEGKHRGELLE